MTAMDLISCNCSSANASPLLTSFPVIPAPPPNFHTSSPLQTHIFPSSSPVSCHFHGTPPIAFACSSWRDLCHLTFVRTHKRSPPASSPTGLSLSPDCEKTCFVTHDCSHKVNSEINSSQGYSFLKHSAA